MNSVNRQVRLAARPVGLPKPSDWELTAEPVPAPGHSEFVVVVSYLSIDPVMRRLIDAAYREPVALGAVMEAGAVGRVTASEHPGFAVGEHVYGDFGVQEFACSDGTGATRLDPLLGPLPAYLGALGIPGLTAYFGLLEVGRLREGEIVVISGAAGGVGSVARPDRARIRRPPRRQEHPRDRGLRLTCASPTWPPRRRLAVSRRKIAHGARNAWLA